MVLLDSANPEPLFSLFIYLFWYVSCVSVYLTPKAPTFYSEGGLDWMYSCYRKQNRANVRGRFILHLYRVSRQTKAFPIVLFEA